MKILERVHVDDLSLPLEAKAKLAAFSISTKISISSLISLILFLKFGFGMRFLRLLLVKFLEEEEGLRDAPILGLDNVEKLTLLAATGLDVKDVL